MTSLTRRRDPNASHEAWLIFYGDLHVGTIGMRSGNPTGGDQWSWSCGFYPGSNPGDATNGTAVDFPAARAAFESAWSVFWRSAPKPIFWNFGSTLPQSHGCALCGMRAVSCRP